MRVCCRPRGSRSAPLVVALRGRYSYGPLACSLASGCAGHNLQALLRVLAERDSRPSAVILDTRALQSTLESRDRAGYDGAKRCKGSKAHLAVDTLGHLLALQVTVANEQDRV